MSDYHDYHENLAFPPQEVKSQDELTERGRQSDVLIKAIEKCKSLEDKIKKYKKILVRIDGERLSAGCYKSAYEFSMKHINLVFENMLDDDFNPKEELDE